MSVKKKNLTITIASFTTNAFLVLAAILVIFYLIAPIFGGEFYSNAILKYASWLGIAFCIKYELSRMKKNFEMRLFDYITITVFVILNIMAWFKFPLSLFLIILCIIGLIFSFIKQKKGEDRKNEEIN